MSRISLIDYKLTDRGSRLLTILNEVAMDWEGSSPDESYRVIEPYTADILMEISGRVDRDISTFDRDRLNKLIKLGIVCRG